MSTKLYFTIKNVHITEKRPIGYEIYCHTSISKHKTYRSTYASSFERPVQIGLYFTLQASIWMNFTVIAVFAGPDFLEAKKSATAATALFRNAVVRN